MTPRSNSPAAIDMLNGAHALLAKALVFVKQAKADVEDVRFREPAYPFLVTDHDSLLRMMRNMMQVINALKETPQGLALFTETPEEG